MYPRNLLEICLVSFVDTLFSDEMLLYIYTVSTKKRPPLSIMA